MTGPNVLRMLRDDIPRAWQADQRWAPDSGPFHTTFRRVGIPQLEYSIVHAVSIRGMDEKDLQQLLRDARREKPKGVLAGSHFTRFLFDDQFGKQWGVAFEGSGFPGGGRPALVFVREDGQEQRANLEGYRSFESFQYDY